MKKNRYKIITAGIIFTIATGILYLINRVIFATAILKDLLKSSAKNQYNWRFGKIYYDKKGSGSPVLLMHDLTVYSSAYEWNQAVDELAKTNTVYAIDLPGCGRSEKQKITYTNYLYVQMLCDFIKNVIREKTDIIASGYSGSFAVMACYSEPDLFNRIIMVNPPELEKLQKIPGKRSKFYKFALEIPIIGTLIYNMFTCQSNVQLLFTEKYFFNPFQINAEMIDTYYEAAHKGFSPSKYLLASIIGNYINNNICHALKAINNSIFIIAGEAEENIENTLEEYTGMNPAIETFTMKHTKHLPHLEHGEEFLTQVNIFLEN